MWKLIFILYNLYTYFILSQTFRKKKKINPVCWTSKKYETKLICNHFIFIIAVTKKIVVDIGKSVRIYYYCSY